ncbi:MAG: peptide chain release factor 2 [Pseudomonadota bacterium]|nr:peptide chain release factor 2 [Pseudomonadota bacterium]
MSLSTELSDIRNMLIDLKQRSKDLRGIFDLPTKETRLEELAAASLQPEVWQDQKRFQKISKEKSDLEKIISSWRELDVGVDDNLSLLDMIQEENDEKSFEDVKAEAFVLQKKVHNLEVQKLLSGELDANSTFLTINSGAGGTEACDWASMLLRMYTKYCNHKGYKSEILEMSEGEGAGIKSATLLITGLYAYGHLKAENGVHRLVRISPFDSNARRHTSFASVFAWAEVDDEIKIEIKTDDIKVDTYRASGAGGQHVNKTDSAIRMTHMPTGIIVQCQSQRSQHANRDTAMKMLKAALYEREVKERNRLKEEQESTKKANEWGSQIRSYVFQPYQMVKDHRTLQETSQIESVMDGDIELFIEAFLKMHITSKVT